MKSPFRINLGNKKAHASNELFEYSYHQPGTLPGTLQIAEDAEPTQINLIDYNAETLISEKDLTPEVCISYLDTESVSWVDVGGLANLKVLQELGKVFSLEPLVMEDIINVPQRPKLEEYKDQLLVISQMVVPRPNGMGFWIEQVSFILSYHYLLTVQEESSQDCFERIRDRLTNNKGGIRQKGADYLFYALWDSIIDGFFPILESFGERIELLEDEVIINPTPQTLSSIHQIKRELLALRRAIWPQRDALSVLIRDGNHLIDPDTMRYLRDCYDHAIVIIDVVETYRELASGLMDVYLSAVSNRMNEVMKVLTVISAIFIPLTFIAGVYGMNFDHSASPYNMPELTWRWGYLGVWAVMLLIAAILVYTFWKKGWLTSN